MTRLYELEAHTCHGILGNPILTDSSAECGLWCLGLPPEALGLSAIPNLPTVLLALSQRQWYDLLHPGDNAARPSRTVTPHLTLTGQDHPFADAPSRRTGSPF